MEVRRETEKNVRLRRKKLGKTNNPNKCLLEDKHLRQIGTEKGETN